jgi:hypothetical protein
VDPVDLAMGEASASAVMDRISVFPGTVATTAPFVKVNSTDDAAMGVFSPITTTAAVTFATVQDVAAVPELGVAPTLAVHLKPGMKLVPITVILLPT